jgi:peroxiredoxin Q/BCP
VKKLVVSLFSAALALSIPSAARAADDAMPNVGSAAPTFTLPSQTGDLVSLKSYHGKWVVLYFYPKDMTQGCTIEAHNFQRDLSKFEAANAVILGVSVDTVDSHKQFCTKDGLTFHLLADPEHKVVDEYGSLGHFGAFTIVKVWTKVDPSHHSEEVLAALDEAKK